MNDRIKLLERLHAAVAPQTVYCVLCINNDDDVVHIFSTQEKATAFAEADPRPHVLYDYVLDCPERMETRQQ